MNQVPINPGCQTEIFEILSEPGKTSFINTEFTYSPFEKAEMLYDYHVTNNDGFVRLRITTQYMASSREPVATMFVASLTKDFIIVRHGRVLPDHIITALWYCVNLMNEDKELKNPTSIYLPEKFEEATLESQISFLAQIVRELNDI